jgi:hypothetical protein
MSGGSGGSASGASGVSLTTKGDLLTFDTSETRLPVGLVNGQVLNVDSTTADGIAWVTPAGGTTISREIDSLGASFTTTNTTKTAITGLSVVLDASGDAEINFMTTCENNAVNPIYFDIYDGTNMLAAVGDQTSVANHFDSVALQHTMDMSSETITARVAGGGATTTLRWNNAVNVAQFIQLKVTKFT